MSPDQLSGVIVEGVACQTDGATGREAAPTESKRPGLGSGAAQTTPRSTHGGCFVRFGTTMWFIITTYVPLRADSTSVNFYRPRASRVLQR
jgi:hypothetical protein